MSKSKFMLPLNIQLFAEGAEESNTSEEVVVQQETTTGTDTSAVDNQTEEVATPQKEVEKPVQSTEDNAKYAAARREAERQLQAERAEKERLLKVLEPFGYKGSALEIADLIEANNTGKTAEEVRAEREAQEQQHLKELQAQQELEHYKSLAYQSMVKEGIDRINKAFPEAKIKDINDLGEDFVRLLSAGLDEVEAYEVMQTRKARTEVPKPQITGEVNGQTTQDKDFFTKDEVERMSQAEVSKNYEKIMKSTAKW